MSSGPYQQRVKGPHQAVTAMVGPLQRNGPLYVSNEPATSRLVATRFSSAEALLEAVRIARAEGAEIADAYTPYPVHGLDAALGLPRSRLPIVAFAAGVVGAISAIGFQFYAAAFDWPLNVGGKPANSTLAFVPITFEITVLVAALTVTAAFLWRCVVFPGRAGM